MIYSTAINRWFRFSLRSLMIVILVAAAFCGGWVSNEMRHRYVLKDNVKVEFIEGTQTMVFRGSREGVEELSDVIESKLDESAEH
jgi:hypothetical protein